MPLEQLCLKKPFQNSCPARVLYTALRETRPLEYFIWAVLPIDTNTKEIDIN